VWSIIRQPRTCTARTRPTIQRKAANYYPFVWRHFDRMKTNFMGVCLLATFIVIFGSVLSMVFFSDPQTITAVSVDAVASEPNP
jgi:hypothetical protein